MAWRVATIPMSHLHSSRNYHQERATELRRLSKDVEVACGAVMLVLHEVSVLVVICGSCEMEEGM